MSKIMIVDDDPNIRSLAVLLQYTLCNIEAADGREALQKMYDDNPERQSSIL